MRLSSLAIIWSTGIAIFSMFFGSGNVVFPLLLGAQTGNQITWALLGLTITAVGAPLLGLLGSVLFEGDCKRFFYRIGQLPGYLAVMLILALLGPIGVMPRCFIVAYGAVKPYLPDLSLFIFSLIAGLVTLVLIARRNLILPVLGYFLSPVLLLSLVVIMITGIAKGGPMVSEPYSSFMAIKEGIVVGYNTMDLLASIIFSVSIWLLLQEKLSIKDDKDIKTKLIPTYVWASIVGGGLLGLVYVGLSFSAALHSAALQNTAPEQVLATLAIHLLGSKLAMVANIAIVLACLTTVMSLAVAVVDVIHVEVMNTSLGKKLSYSYGWMMFITMVITVIFTNLGFAAIMAFLNPIMSVCYPAIIVLTVCNILYKLYGFPYVKMPVYSTFVATLLYKGFTMG
ncbi:branched-chain amino acid transport system II carrier protein [Candidatus Berkiella aquae]|uniref:Branched-chain amino acid transport system carrier protein n=1 Tax=Candidatus Berkiella aquae TaxID=295108 RepID=A0A0Q9YMR2_9GAMM|nr:branched-chain amino acid transport system II carrier protein [Candidatus Berkiella aquae]MCS5711171.1 branched-chain amino acid transport system II carrier protein [Candidatus Berkiella aquae]